MRRTAILLIMLLAALLASCNLDSNQGVLQMAFNATHKTSYTIIDVYGAYDNDDNGTKVLINRDWDLWYVETDGNDLVQHKVKDLTQGAVTPIFINGNGTLFYAYRPEHTGPFSFGSASIDDIASDDFDFSGSTSDSAELQGITKFDCVNLNLDECLIIWGTDENTYYKKIENKSSQTSFSLSGSVDITTLSTKSGTSVNTKGVTIFGTDALFAYYEDSDLDNTPNQLAVIRIVNGVPEAITLGVDEDNIPMGSDNGYFITYDGDLYQFNTSENGYGRISGFVSDLRYRINHRLVLSNEGDRAVGFIYRNGVYVRENTADNVRPKVLSIDNNDNDIISASYIGHSTAQDGDDWYLFATQNNSFIILEVGPGTLNDEGTRYNYTVSDSMLQSYEPQIHGQLSAYIN